jgi:hypothetical protein
LSGFNSSCCGSISPGFLSLRSLRLHFVFACGLSIRHPVLSVSMLLACFHSVQLLRTRFASLRSRFLLLRFLSFAFNLLGCCSYPTHSAFSVPFPCASLRLAVVELPSHSVSSRSFCLGFDLFHLRLRIVSFRLACLRLHSTSTFLHISGRPVLRPQGGGVGHRRQNKHQKHQTKTNQKKKPATITTPRKRSR